MEIFGLYLLRSSIWMAAFTIIFFLFLRNERYFGLKRIYLLAGAILSFIMPFVNIYYTIELTALPDVQAVNPTASAAAVPSGDNSLMVSILSSFYLTGIVVILVRTVVQSRKLMRTIISSEISMLSVARIIRSDVYSTPFSFFSWVFINPSVPDAETREIIKHELVHIRQKHWADLILAELLCIIQWFNPFSWLYRHFVRQNHEYLADEGALMLSPDPAIYKAALLNQIAGITIFSLTNPFGYSLTTRRFNMMKSGKESPGRKFRILLIVPVMVVILFAFATPRYLYSDGRAEGESNHVIQPESQIAEGIIKGVVLQQSGAPLIGAVVIGKGTTIGTVTDPTGNFTLSDLPAGTDLVVTYVGFVGKVIKPDYSQLMRITMVRDTLGIMAARLTNEPPPPPPPPQPGSVKSGTMKDTGREKSGSGEQYTVVEELPSFEGGYQALNDWMIKNFRYPPDAVKKNITGDVKVVFIVGENGSVSDVRVEKPVHPLLDEEAVRLVSEMPKWNPGRQNGKPVAVYMKMPVNFRLK